MFKTVKESMEARGWAIGDLRKKMVLSFSKAPVRQTLSNAIEGNTMPSLEVAIMIHRSLDEDFDLVSLVPLNKLKYIAPIATEEKAEEQLDFSDLTSEDIEPSLTTDDLLEGLDDLI